MTTKKTPAVKSVINSAMANELKSSFRSLRDSGFNYISNEWNGGNSVSIALPDGFQAFISKLPAGEDCSAEVRTFRKITKNLTSLFGESRISFVIHRGSMMVSGRFADAEKIAA